MSRRERVVLELIIKGLDNRQIGDELSISYHTVRSHRRKIYDTLGVGSSVEAIFAAWDQGYLTACPTCKVSPDTLAGPHGFKSVVLDLPRVVPAREPITDTQVKIIEMLAKGFVALDICTELGISESVTRYEMSKLYAILGVRNAAALVSRAYEYGILVPGMNTGSQD